MTGNDDPDLESIFEHWPNGQNGRMSGGISTKAVPSTVDMKQAAFSESMVEESNHEDESSSDSSESASPSDPPWRLSNSRGGQLHVAPNNLTLCLRALKSPKIGIGLSAARAADAEWSPRCFRKLKREHQQAWISGDFD